MRGAVERAFYFDILGIVDRWVITLAGAMEGLFAVAATRRQGLGWRARGFGCVLLRAGEI